MNRHLRTSLILVMMLSLTGATDGNNISIAQTKDTQLQFNKTYELASITDITVKEDSKVEVKEIKVDESWYIPSIPMDYEEQKFLYKQCEKFNYPYLLALAQIKYESSYDQSTRGSSGEIGMYQILPSWDRYLEQELNKKIDLKDSFTNLECGLLLMYYNSLNYKDEGDYEKYIKSLNVYNMGSANYNRYCKSNAYDRWHYGKNIWATYMQFKKGNFDYDARK